MTLKFLINLKKKTRRKG